VAEETERFAQRMRKQIGVPVEMADERLTSWEAERMLEEEFGRKSKQLDGASRKRTPASSRWTPWRQRLCFRIPVAKFRRQLNHLPREAR
jgi:hypothetical protein